MRYVKALVQPFSRQFETELHRFIVMLKFTSGRYNYRQSINPFIQNISIVDCGDLPISPFDNGLAFAQMEEWYTRLLDRKVKNPHKGVKSFVVCPI